MRKDDQKFVVIKISKRVVKSNQDITGNQCIRNDGVLAVKDEYKKIACKRHYENILNTELALIGTFCQIDTDSQSFP